MPKKIRDSQRSRVYTWESAYIDIDNTYKLLDRVAVVRFIEQVCVGMKVYPPKLWVAGYATAGRTRLGVSLPHNTWRKGIILHELSHWAIPFHSEESHGAEFMGRYIDLLSQYLGWDKDTMIESARFMGIRVA